MTLLAVGTITVVSCLVLSALIAIPLALRKVPPNIVFGYRTRTTLSDERIWYEANAHFGRGLLVASLMSSVVVVVLYQTESLSPLMFLRISIVVVVVPVLVATIATARYIRRL